MAETSPLTDGLIRIHRLLSRALSVSISKCDEYLKNGEIPPNERKGFLLYMQTFIRVMHAHHMGEDDVVFPYCTGRIEAPYGRLKDEHISIAVMLDNLDKDIAQLSIASVPKMRKVLAEIQRLWGPHILAEETSFAVENLTGLSIQEQDELVENVGKHSQKSAGPGPLTIPFVLYNLDKEDRQEFLKDLPWILKYLLIPVVWRRQWKPMDHLLLN